MFLFPNSHHRQKAVVCNFGTGGHTEQMRRLLSYIDFRELILIAQSPTKPENGFYTKYSKISKVRPDYANIIGILEIPFCAAFNFIQTLRLFIRYDIRLLISTGSGVAIIPSIVAKLFRSKVIFFESWSRFSVPSISGRFMYHIADLFFVQNEDIKKFYRNAIWMGQL